MVARGRSNRGEKHPNAKLTAVQVLAIRQQPNSSARDLAAQFGVSPSTIKAIRKSRNWGWA
jgi:hypothetical protein